MFRARRVRRTTAIALVLFAVLFSLVRAASQPSREPAAAASARPAGVAGARTLSAVRTLSATKALSPARTLSATRPDGGPCSVPGIGDIGGLLGFCSLGQSGLIGGLNDLCNPDVPQPESATSGVNALIRPPASAGRPVATPYSQYAMAGQFWAPYDLQCSDMTALIGNDVAGMLFDFAKALDRVTITVYQSAAGEGILSWLQNATDHLISGLGKAIYFPYVALVVIIAAIWLAWQGLIRKRGTRTIEGTIWMVLACAAAIWLIGRPADFTGLGKGVSDGISTTLNTAFAHLPSPGQSGCLPVSGHDPQISRSSYSYTSGRTVVDQNANELWTVLVCKPWLDGEFGTTAFAASGKATPVSAYARQLLWAQAIAVNERPTSELIGAKQAAYAGIAQTIKGTEPSVYPLFQGKQWTTRLEIAFAALLAALIAGVLVLLISVTLILLKLGFLLLLIVGPFFLLIGTHPGFGRVVAVRWFEMLAGVLLKQAAVALALSVLLYSYALIMGTADAVLPWALKILMITLVTVAVIVYRKPFQHLFAAVGYGTFGATDRAEADLDRAAAAARANTRTAATLALPGFAAYRAARWARRNPAQAAGLALTAAAAAGTAGAAAGAAGIDGVGSAGEHHGAGAEPAGATPGAAGSVDSAGSGVPAGVAARARAWGASAGTASASEAPPLKLPPSQSVPTSWANGGAPVSGPSGGNGTGSSAPPLPPLARSAGTSAASSAGGQARTTAGPGAPSRRAPGAPQRQGGSGGRGAAVGPGVPPSWSARGQAARRTARPPAPSRSGWGGGPAGGGSRQDAARPRRGSADRIVPEQPVRARAAGTSRSSWPWTRSGGGPARQDSQARSGSTRRRPAGGSSPDQGRPEGGTFSGLPYGVQPKEPDEPPASPFWSRPIWRRK
jgi:TrbL/VirB6 plasmid conjugal transfer protein